MKKLNIICIITALIFVLLFGLYFGYNKKNKDTEAPVINMDLDTIECSIDSSQEELTKGLTATDNVDGDISNHIMVNDIHVKDNNEENKPKEFNITYVVFDSSNNMTFASRKLIYTDYHSPHFSLSENLRFNSISAVDLYKYLGATDCIDGDISSQITVEMGDAYLNAISYGVYDCTASVTNSVGDTAELPLTLEIYDSTSSEEIKKPKILLNNYLVYLKVGGNFQPENYLKGIIIDNFDYWLVDISEVYDESTEEFEFGYTNQNYKRFIPENVIDIKMDVDKNKPGTYTVVYSFRHPETDVIGTTKLKVIVE